MKWFALFVLECLLLECLYEPFEVLNGTQSTTQLLGFIAITVFLAGVSILGIIALTVSLRVTDQLGSMLGLFVIQRLMVTCFIGSIRYLLGDYDSYNYSTSIKIASCIFLFIVGIALSVFSTSIKQSVQTRSRYRHPVRYGRRR